MSDQYEEDRASQPTLLLSDPKQIKGNVDKTCKICKGEGFYDSDLIPNKKRICDCRMLDFGKKYLTPAYEKEQWDKALDIASLRDNDLTIIAKRGWKQIVKTYLLRTGMIYSHLTVAPRSLMAAYLNKSNDDADWANIHKSDVLFIHAAFDIPNRQYGNLIIGIISDRRNMGKTTWLITPHPLDSDAFKNSYSAQLAAFLKENTQQVDLA